MNPKLGYILIILGGIAFLLNGCGNVTPTTAPIEYEISNTLWDYDSNGELYFEFVVKNIGDVIWEDAIGGVVLYDEKDSKIGEFAYEDMSQSAIAPGEYAYFYIRSHEKLKFHRYSLSFLATVDPRPEDIDCLDGTTEARDLVIVETGREPLEYDFMNFYGVAVNTNKLKATTSYGYLAILDKDGKLINVEICSPHVRELDWKEQAAFKCRLGHTIPEDAKLAWMFDTKYQCKVNDQTP